MKQKLGYEKIALGVAVVVALGCGTSITLNAERLAEDFPDHWNGGNAPVPEIGQGESAAIDQVGQAVPIAEDEVFTVSPHFVMKKNGELIVIDFGDPGSPMVHPPIPNKWWIENEIDPTRANAGRRDEDGDGYSNREEFVAKTDPKKVEDHPPLIKKLKLKGIKQASLRLSYVSDNCEGAPKLGNTFGFRYQDLQRKKNTQGNIGAGLGAGSRFFGEAPAQLRFELKAVSEVPIFVKAINANRPVKVATVLDLHQKGKVWHIQKGSGNGVLIHDHEAELFVDAAGEVGRGQHFAVGETFRLPFGSKEGQEYKVNGITGIKKGKRGEKDWEVKISKVGEKGEAEAVMTLSWKGPNPKKK